MTKALKSFLSDRLAVLRKGERWWAAELVLRVLGLVALAGCIRLALRTHALIMASPRHAAGAIEFIACGAIFLLWSAGFALVYEGPGLFRHVPVPPHSAFLRSRYG